MSANESIQATALPVALAAAPERDYGRSIRYDALALLTCGLIAVVYSVLSTDLRTASPIGSAIRIDSLRKAVTVMLAFLASAVYIGDSIGARHKAPIGTALRYGCGLLLGLYVLYAASFTFFGQEWLTGSGLPAVAEIGALLCVVGLWQPWTRLAVYSRAWPNLLPALAIALAVLIVWQVIVAAFDIKQFLLPAPTVIITTFFTVYPRLVAQGWITFQNALWGFAIGCGAGVLTGLLSARFSGFSRTIMPYAIAANSIPIIAFAPITNNWFGLLNPLSKIAVVAILTYFPAMINTLRGLTLADRTSLELMRSYAASERQVFLKVRLPTALPYIFAGLKIACTLSMIGAIVAEYFGGPTTGLGVNIANDAALIRYPTVWSEIIIASMLGLAFYFVVSLVERLAMPWHVSFRTEVPGS